MAPRLVCAGIAAQWLRASTALGLPRSACATLLRVDRRAVAQRLACIETAALRLRAFARRWDRCAFGSVPSPGWDRCAVGSAPSPSWDRCALGSAPSPSWDRCAFGSAPSPSLDRRVAAPRPACVAASAKPSVGREFGYPYAVHQPSESATAAVARQRFANRGACGPALVLFAQPAIATVVPQGLRGAFGSGSAPRLTGSGHRRAVHRSRRVPHYEGSPDPGATERTRAACRTYGDRSMWRAEGSAARGTRWRRRRAHG